MILSKMSKIKRIILAIILIGTTFIMFISVYIVSELKNGEQILNEMTFTEIDLASISDGTYTGEFKAGLVSAKVETTIQDNKIIDIKLIEHNNGKGSAAESIIDDIIIQQTTDVDLISKATISSKVIRKAIENSLKKQ